MRVVLASSYELLGPEQVTTWNRLADRASREGLLLFLLTTNRNPELRMPHLEIPYRLDGFARFALEPEPPRHLDALLTAERQWQTPGDPQTTRIGAGKCRTFYQQLCTLLAPSAVLLWNTHLPHSRIARHVCQEQELPVFTLERGQLPGTWLLDSQRNVQESELGSSFALHSAQQTHEVNEERLQQYAAWYRDARAAKYRSTRNRGFEELKLRAAQQAVTLVLGAVRGAHPSANLPEDSSTLARLLAHLTATTPHAVAFRDHPINQHIAAALPIGETMIRAAGGSLLDYLELSSEVVCLGPTTALYEALLLEKPVLQLGANRLNAPSYVATEATLEPTLTRMRQAGFDELRAPARRTLSFLLEHYLIATNSDVPVRNGLDALTRFLNELAAEATSPLDHRLRGLEQWAQRL